VRRAWPAGVCDNEAGDARAAGQLSSRPLGGFTMRYSQPPSEKTRWPKAFLSLLQDAFPEYELNRLARGTRTECLRVERGVFFSQNTICLHGQYHHCFAVSLTRLLTPTLYSPFWTGARFDHDHTIFWAFERDLGLPVRGPDAISGLHSTHQWRRGTDDIVRKCTANAEKYLAPHYLAELVRARPLLLDVVGFLTENPTVLHDEGFLASYRRPLEDSRDLSLRHFAHAPQEWGPFESELPQVLSATCAHKFRPHLSELDDIYRRLEHLSEAA